MTRRLLATLCAALLPLAADATPRAWELLRATPEAGISPAATRVAAISADLETLRNDARIELPLFDAARDFRTMRVEDHGAGRFSWFGVLDGNTEYQAALTVVDGAIAGHVATPDGFYEITPTAGGALLQAIDHSRFPACGGAIEAEPGPVPVAAKTSGAIPEDLGNDIRLLVMYSPAAEAAAGSAAAIQAQAQAAVDSANLAFENSQMRMRFVVASIERLDGWVEGSASASTELGNFRSNATAQARRDALQADLVSLLVANLPGACGIGYVMRSTNVNFAVNGYQLTDRDCAVGNLSWAHEHGHNVGFEHDPANGTSPATASRPWSFGHYVESGTPYRTVMSYQCPQGNCTRRPYFSNPRVTFNGAPTGIDRQRDNARTGDAVADIVSNFRMSTFSHRNGFE
jgi:hypothetical protein